MKSASRPPPHPIPDERADERAGRALLSWLVHPFVASVLTDLARRRYRAERPGASDEVLLGAFVRDAAITQDWLPYRDDLRDGLRVLNPNLLPDSRRAPIFRRLVTQAVRGFCLAHGADPNPLPRFVGLRAASLRALARLVPADGAPLVHALRDLDRDAGNRLRKRARLELSNILYSREVDRWHSLRGRIQPTGPYYCHVDEDGLHRDVPAAVDDFWVALALGPTPALDHTFCSSP